MVDLNHTSPFEDLFYLLRSPRAFFRQLHSLPQLSAQLFVKAISGLLVFSWLKEFVGGAKWMESAAHQSHWILSDSKVAWFLKDVNLELLQGKIFAVLLALGQIKMAFFPIWSLVDVLGLTASVLLFLPLVGVSKERLSFFPFFLSFVYIKWLLIFALLPKIGPFIAATVIFVFTVKISQWILSVGFGRAFAATYLLYFFSFIFLPLVGFSLGAAGFLLLGWKL